MAQWNQALCQALIGNVTTSSDAIAGLLQRVMGEAASQAFDKKSVEQDPVPLEKAAELQVTGYDGSPICRGARSLCAALRTRGVSIHRTQRAALSALCAGP